MPIAPGPQPRPFTLRLILISLLRFPAHCVHLASTIHTQNLFYPRSLISAPILSNELFILATNSIIILNFAVNLNMVSSINPQVHHVPTWKLEEAVPSRVFFTGKTIVSHRQQSD